MKGFSIDHACKTPVYKQLVAHFENMVHSGIYKVGDIVPSMNELSADLDISKETVKKAYSVLRDRGVLDAQQGKGFYISQHSELKKCTILVLFDKLSQYKQVLFDSFTGEIGDRAEVTICLHNQSIDLFEYYIDENLGKYDYYVITPHFPLDPKSQKRVLKILGRIPNRKLILVDKSMPELPGNYGVVYQDFDNDIYTGLSDGLQRLREYDRLNVVTLPSSLYGNHIRKAVSRFCKDYGIGVEFHSSVVPDIIRKNEVYLILNSQLNFELIALVRRARELGLEIGKDIGIISYNESPINEIILNGLTTVSTDFCQMGKSVAGMITGKSMYKLKCDFHLISRSTF